MNRIATSMIDVCFFFFNDTATTEIYTLSLHDALPISSFFNDLMHTLGDRGRALIGRSREAIAQGDLVALGELLLSRRGEASGDRKSTRLNSSHANISYAVFCLKKKTYITPRTRLHTAT